MDCLIRLAQTDATLGNLGANLETHVAEIELAIGEGVDVIVFPELSLSGYFLKDQTAEVALALDAPELEALCKHSQHISIIVGFVERSGDGRVYNSLALLEDGEVRHVHRKVHLVTYGMFEESRDLAAGDRFEVFASKHGRFGFLICEDLWHVDGAYLYFLDGADAIVVASASPGRGVTAGSPGLESSETCNKLQDALALFFRTWVLMVNRVGWEDGIVFGGASRAVDPFGCETGAPLGLDPDRLDVRVTSDALDRARIQTPLRRDEKPWILTHALARRMGLGLREQDDKS